MKITKRLFDTLPDGSAVYCWTLENDRGLRAELLDYGARLQSLFVPDRSGRLVDVVRGYDTLEGYLNGGSFYGATVGRYCNRIRGGRFTLNGQEYTLACNNGANHLHGGVQGFDKHLWQAEALADGVAFSRLSPDGEEGYPGNLRVRVCYSWRGDTLRIRYHAVCDSDTIVNLTNHSYFNLNGSGDVNGQLLMLNADTFTPNAPDCIPTGEIAPVAGTAMDFRTMKPIGRDADCAEPCVQPFGGYDANFVFAPGKPAAVAKSPDNGIVMVMTTDQPGVQFYTVNAHSERIGKNGEHYGWRSSFCLETQHFPDCVHHPDWPDCVLRAGEVYESETAFAFSVEL